MPLKTGKKPFVPNDKDFTIANLVAETTVPLPEPPKGAFGHGRAYKDWKMLGNGPDNTVTPGFGGAGDCVLAGGDHETMLTNKLAGHSVSVDGKCAISDYSAVTGYVIGDDSTDQGTEVRTALSYRRRTGLVDIGGARHKIGAYVLINPQDWHELMQAVYVFTCVGIGFSFPESAMEQFDHGMPWDVVEGSPIEGGHYVPVLGRSSASVAGVVTWAKRQGMTRAFYEQYNDEAWAIVFPEELRNGKTERGYDLATLNAWLKELPA